MDRVNAQKKRRLRRVGAACPEWVEGRGISGLRAQASSAVGASASTVPHGGRERWGGTDPCREGLSRLEETEALEDLFSSAGAADEGEDVADRWWTTRAMPAASSPWPSTPGWGGGTTGAPRSGASRPSPF